MSNKRKDGRYQYQLFLGMDADGKRITKAFYGKTMKEARQKAEDWKRQKHEYEGSFKYVADLYSKDIEDTTFLHRLAAFTDKLGHMKIADINASDLEEILKELALMNPSTGKPTSQRTVARYRDAVNQVFLYACKNRMISFNPCAFVSLPKCLPPKKRNALKLEEIAQIESLDHKADLPALVMVYCGLRRGELTALQWADVDLKNKTITVNKAYDFKKKTLKGTKTVSGIRTVPVPDKLLARMESARKGKKKTDYVICNDEGNMMTAAAWNNFLDGLVARVGFNFGWHMLRHTYATILYSAGVDVLTAQKLLGHSDVKTTMSVYTHLADDKRQTSIDRLNAYLT
jgi:integrase